MTIKNNGIPHEQLNSTLPSAEINIKVSKNYTAPKHSTTQILFAPFGRSVRPLRRLHSYNTYYVEL